MPKGKAKTVDTLRIPIRVVFYKEGSSLVAHCLEFDLIGDGKTHKAAIKMLCEAISLQVAESLESGNLKNLFTPAPGEFFRMFAAGESNQRAGKAVGELKLEFDSIDISDVDGREYLAHENHDQALAMV